MFSKSKKIVLLLIFIAIMASLSQLELRGALVEAKKTDILFLKGKFILKDKKGSIVISDDKCHCPHYYR